METTFLKKERTVRAIARGENPALTAEHHSIVTQINITSILHKTAMESWPLTIISMHFPGTV